MRHELRWNEWNIDHIASHGVEPEEAEYVVFHASPPYPSHQGDGKILVRGRTSVGRFLQVVYVLDEDGETIYVIHARPMNDREKRAWRRRQR